LAKELDVSFLPSEACHCFVEIERVTAFARAMILEAGTVGIDRKTRALIVTAKRAFEDAIVFNTTPEPKLLPEHRDRQPRDCLFEFRHVWKSFLSEGDISLFSVI
jgi:hypothetical protein